MIVTNNKTFFKPYIYNKRTISNATIQCKYKLILNIHTLVDDGTSIVLYVTSGLRHCYYVNAHMYAIISFQLNNHVHITLDSIKLLTQYC